MELPPYRYPTMKASVRNMWGKAEQYLRKMGGIILIALFVIGGQFAGFDNDDWWEQSKLLPHVQVVADWIKVMAPQGLEIITPDEAADSLPVDIPIEV